MWRCCTTQSLTVTTEAVKHLFPEYEAIQSPNDTPASQVSPAGGGLLRSQLWSLQDDETQKSSCFSVDVQPPSRQTDRHPSRPLSEAEPEQTSRRPRTGVVPTGETTETHRRVRIYELPLIACDCLRQYPSESTGRDRQITEE